MKGTAGRRWLTVLGVTVTVAAGSLVLGSATSPRGVTSVGGPRGGTADRAALAARPLDRATATAELADLREAGSTPARTKLAELMDAPGAPTCAPPPIPAATYPPGNSYGIPFLATITGGQVLAGYDEWTANHLTWVVDVDGTETTYNLYPWQSKIYDITGWVTGLIQLPSLTADITPQDIEFCDNQGNADCLSADWPAGQCIHILAQYGPSPASPTPPPALGNDHPEGTSCYGYSTPTFSCFPFVVSLTPSGDTSLTVTGVEPDGALDLSVSTAAVTTVSEVPPPPSTTIFTCSDDPTSVTLSTVAPSGLPATAPVAPDPPNTDDRVPQTVPEPDTGPLATSTSTVVSNDFQIPAFFPSPGGTPCSPTVAETLNTYAGGWNGDFRDQDKGLYYVDGGHNPIAAEPGWAQFSATTTLVTLSLPQGPPAGFSF
jgi:hypothetical protein